MLHKRVKVAELFGVCTACGAGVFLFGWTTIKSMMACIQNIAAKAINVLVVACTYKSAIKDLTNSSSPLSYRKPLNYKYTEV